MADADEEFEKEFHEPNVLATTSSKRGLIPVTVNNYPIEGLVDTGSDLSFIEASFLHKHDIKFSKSDRSITLANDSVFKIVGKLNATVSFKNQQYSVELLAVQSLVAPMIIGMDILGENSQLTLLLGGKLDPTIIRLALTRIVPPTY